MNGDRSANRARFRNVASEIQEVDASELLPDRYEGSHNLPEETEVG
jgi:hypothetical protein